MKKYLVIVIMMSLVVCMFGCVKKEANKEVPLEPLSMEELSRQAAQPVAPTETPVVVQPVSPAEPNLSALPPSGPYKPTPQEIQTALKNANFYTGTIDGKVGPRTKKAIEEFQKANSLQVDGKVGPKTWAILSPYLNPQPAPAASTNQ